MHVDPFPVSDSMLLIAALSMVYVIASYLHFPIMHLQIMSLKPWAVMINDHHTDPGADGSNLASILNTVHTCMYLAYPK